MVVVNFYFIHAKWLKDRQKVIDNFTKIIRKYIFRTVKIGTINVIEEMDPEAIDHEFIKQNVNYTPFTEPNLVNYNGFLRNMHINQLSNVMKHYKAYESIKSASDDEIHIILEDDIIFEEKMCFLLEKLVRNIPVKHDLIFLGLPTNKEIKDRNNIAFQNTSELMKIIPYCDSYVISKEAATKLHENFLPIKFIMNFQLSYLMDKLDLSGQLVYPNIFMDGSKVGAFVSHLNPNNVLMFNNDYNNVRNILSKTEITPEEDALLNKIFNASPLSGHPDFSYLKAKYLVHVGNYIEAKKCYEKTYNMYKDKKTIINHESFFLKDYIRLFKHLQTDIEL